MIQTNQKTASQLALEIDEELALPSHELTEKEIELLERAASALRGEQEHE